jgi:MFS family permease
MANAQVAEAILLLVWVRTSLQTSKLVTGMVLLGLWVSSGVIMQGFDIVAGGQLAALPEFQKQFGRLQPDGSHIIPAHYLSAWNSIAPACEIASTFIYAPLLEKYGRKPGILVASAISVAGVLLQQLATDWRVHLAGRGVNGRFVLVFLTYNTEQMQVLRLV